MIHINFLFQYVILTSTTGGEYLFIAKRPVEANCGDPKSFWCLCVYFATTTKNPLISQ